MDAGKRKRLEAAGWTVGNTSDFLELTSAETELVELKVQLALLVTMVRTKLSSYNTIIIKA